MDNNTSLISDTIFALKGLDDSYNYEMALKDITYGRKHENSETQISLCEDGFEISVKYLHHWLWMTCTVKMRIYSGEIYINTKGSHSDAFRIQNQKRAHEIFDWVVEELLES